MVRRADFFQLWKKRLLALQASRRRPTGGGGKTLRRSGLGHHEGHPLPTYVVKKTSALDPCKMKSWRRGSQLAGNHSAH